MVFHHQGKPYSLSRDIHEKSNTHTFIEGDVPLCSEVHETRYSAWYASLKTSLSEYMRHLCAESDLVYG